MTSNKDTIHRLCRPIRLFMEAPENTKVQVFENRLESRLFMFIATKRLNRQLVV